MRIHARLAITLLGILLGACQSASPRHALYLPAAPTNAETSSPPQVRVHLPSYVDRRLLLQRLQDGRLTALDGGEWAESPADGYARLMRERLQLTPGAATASIVQLHFTRFELEPDGVFRARGDWQVRQDGRMTASGALDYDAPLTRMDSSSLVDAMSQSITEFAALIRRHLIEGHQSRADSHPRTTEDPHHE